MFGGVHEPVDRAEEGHGRCDHTSVILGPVRKREDREVSELTHVRTRDGEVHGKMKEYDPKERRHDDNSISRPPEHGGEAKRSGGG